MACSEVDDFDVSRPSRIASSEDGPAVVELPPGRQGHSLMMTWANPWPAVRGLRRLWLEQLEVA